MLKKLSSFGSSSNGSNKKKQQQKHVTITDERTVITDSGAVVCKKKSSKTLTTATNDDDVDTFSTPSNKSPPAPIPVTPMNGSIPNGTRPFESNDDSKSNQTVCKRSKPPKQKQYLQFELPIMCKLYIMQYVNHCLLLYPFLLCQILVKFQQNDRTTNASSFYRVPI